jgi:hypothetical protein
MSQNTFKYNAVDDTRGITIWMTVRKEAAGEN